MTKINFNQPKYIFPAIIFVPVCFLAYFVTELFGGNSSANVVATDQINATLPDANSKEPMDKLSEMQLRFGDEDDAHTAVGAIGEDKEDRERIEHGYSEDELNNIDAAEAERLRIMRQKQEMERSLAASRKHINSYDGGYDEYGSNGGSGSYASDIEAIQQQALMRQQMLNNALGFNQTANEEARKKLIEDSIARAKEVEREKNRPLLVLKSQEANANHFNTVSGHNDEIDAPLIKAMIDLTTKAHEGTRIRFKLLDNVTIRDIHLPKGTYLYGTVSGFSQQRVKAKITSILVGNRFLNVNLSVYDNDGMEGFYVPESAFRDFLKEAGASAVQQNVQLNSGYSGVSVESVALQALQNIYNSATSAISANIRKNKAKIKYNTIVYLINSDDAK